MTRPEDYPVSAEQKAKQTLDRMAAALSEAAAVVAPGETGKSLLEIFPEPGERRADTEFVMFADREEYFREAMAKLGIGRETNLTATEAGIQGGYIAVIEGGQAHKMVAELNAVFADQATRPNGIIIAGTKDRVILPSETDKVKERQTTAKVLGITEDQVGQTEFDVARQVAENIAGFHKTEDHSPNLSYDMEGNVSFEDPGDDPGQFTRIGFYEQLPVVLLRVDREYTPDGKSYKTLGVNGLLKVVDGYLNVWNIQSDIGLVTSSTYQPSREVDAASTMLEIEQAGDSRNIGVITYGTVELAAVKGEQPSQPTTGQLAGEAHKAAQQLAILRDLINSPEQA